MSYVPVKTLLVYIGTPTSEEMK